LVISVVFRYEDFGELGRIFNAVGAWKHFDEKAKKDIADTNQNRGRTPRKSIRGGPAPAASTVSTGSNSGTLDVGDVTEHRRRARFGQVLRELQLVGVVDEPPKRTRKKGDVLEQFFVASDCSLDPS